MTFSDNRDVQKTRMKRDLKFRVNVLASQFIIQKIKKHICLHVLFEEKPKGQLLYHVSTYCFEMTYI